MRIEPIPYEQRDAADYPHELDGLAFQAARCAGDVRGQVRAINDVSYLQIGEAATLWNLYADCSDTGQLVNYPALEVGARFGCSTMTLALCAKYHGGWPLISVDPHNVLVHTKGYHTNSLEILADNVRRADLSEYVHPVLARSWDVARWVKGPLALVFIDGAHDTDSVHLDITAWFQKMASGGVLCGHDYQEENTSVKDAVDQFVANTGLPLRVEQSIWAVQK